MSSPHGVFIEGETEKSATADREYFSSRSSCRDCRLGLVADYLCVPRSSYIVYAQMVRPESSGRELSSCSPSFSVRTRAPASAEILTVFSPPSPQSAGQADRKAKAEAPKSGNDGPVVSAARPSLSFPPSPFGRGPTRGNPVAPLRMRNYRGKGFTLVYRITGWRAGSRGRTEEVHEGLITDSPHVSQHIHKCKKEIVFRASRGCCLLVRARAREDTLEGRVSLKVGLAFSGSAGGQEATASRSRSAHPQTNLPHSRLLPDSFSCQNHTLVVRPKNARSRRPVPDSAPAPARGVPYTDPLPCRHQREADNPPGQGGSRAAKRRRRHARNQGEERDGPRLHGSRRGHCRVSEGSRSHRRREIRQRPYVYPLPCC